MSKSLGDRLRAQRERQHITLSSIAVQTKIQLALLEGLERDDVSHWPGGIFRRAFVRAYARAIDLEPDVVVREFLERYPDPIDVTETGLPPAAAAHEAPASRASSTRLCITLIRPERLLPGCASGFVGRSSVGTLCPTTRQRP